MDSQLICIRLYCDVLKSELSLVYTYTDVHRYQDQAQVSCSRWNHRVYMSLLAKPMYNCHLLAVIIARAACAS